MRLHTIKFGTHSKTVKITFNIIAVHKNLIYRVSFGKYCVLKGIFYAECTQQTPQHDIIFGGEKMFGFACR